uniref:Uncharacterized protein n=1 Tax=Amphimedon queenslandica TaxID=400682 RepID=A0A1X7SVQ2_AMPQE
FNHHLKLYDVHISRSLWFVVIENHDKFYHYRISIDFTGTINLKLSRNGLQIDDYIPPQHRQVLVVIFPEDEQNVIHRYQYSIKSQPCMHNPNGEWGSFMSPPLTDVNRELHSPRHLYILKSNDIFMELVACRSSKPSDTNIMKQQMANFIKKQDEETDYLLGKSVRPLRPLRRKKRWYQKCCIIL